MKNEISAKDILGVKEIYPVKKGGKAEEEENLRAYWYFKRPLTSGFIGRPRIKAHIRPK